MRLSCRCLLLAALVAFSATGASMNARMGMSVTVVSSLAMNLKTAASVDKLEIRRVRGGTIYAANVSGTARGYGTHAVGLLLEPRGGEARAIGASAAVGKAEAPVDGKMSVFVPDAAAGAPSGAMVVTVLVDGLPH